MGLFSKAADVQVQQQPVSAPVVITPDNMPSSRYADDNYREAAQYLISNTELIEQTKDYFRGRMRQEKYDEKTGEYKIESVDVGEPFMNEKGIQRIMGYVEIMLARNSVMSNLKEEFINNLMLEENEIISVHLISNQEKYEIKDDDLQLIIDEVEDVMYICLMRSEQRGEATLVLKGRREAVVRNIDEAAQMSIAKQNRPVIGWRP